MNQALADLKQRLAEIFDLERALGVMGWDQRTMMPPKGAAARAEAAATLSGVIHERFISDEIGRLLDQVASLETELGHDSDDASLVRVTRREWEKARRVPAELAAAWAREGGKAHVAWLEAREQNDFSVFLPALRRVHDVALRWAELMERGDSPYDAFLDEYEPGMTTAEVKAVFDVLQPELTAIVRDAGQPADNSFLEGDFPIPAQEEFLAGILRDFGFEEGTYRLDPTVHPFASGTGITDIRITTRYFSDHLGGLFGTMHEFGHGLYERQVDPALERSPLARGVSLGMHESQSRMWENLVGRSLPFWRHFFPRLQELFPTLAGEDAESWYREVNRVEPSLIRVEADEATYNLHIILRFELEQAMLGDEFPLEELPEQWNSRMWDYLGIEVPSDTEGVLQDVHWSGGSIGYFPTYALGNLISAQIWEKITADLPSLESDFEQGEFGGLRDWLRDNLHSLVRKYTPGETLERVVGTPEIDPEPYVRYLRDKVGAIYGLPAAAA